jgi:hypothetical protein
VVKSHWNAGVTGSIKNISIGASPPRIYGQTSGNIGRNNMVTHSSQALQNWITDYFLALPADFVVMDGLQGIENGPEPSVSSAAQLAGYQRNLRLIMASKDALAIDTVEANLINWDYTTVGYITKLTARGMAMTKPNGREILLRGNPKDIIVLGNKKVDDVRYDFRNTQNFTAGSAGSAIAAANKNPSRSIVINSAEFSGALLNLSLTPSANIVKLDVYIDGIYKKSFNSDMTSVSLNASTLPSGSHNIEVRAFTSYMYCTTASTTAVK